MQSNSLTGEVPSKYLLGINLSKSLRSASGTAVSASPPKISSACSNALARLATMSPALEREPVLDCQRGLTEAHGGRVTLESCVGQPPRPRQGHAGRVDRPCLRDCHR